MSEVRIQLHERNKAVLLIIIFCKTTFTHPYNPLGLLAMFQLINIELVNQQPEGKGRTMRYLKRQKCHSVCFVCFVGNENVSQPEK